MKLANHAHARRDCSNRTLVGTLSVATFTCCAFAMTYFGSAPTVFADEQATDKTNGSNKHVSFVGMTHRIDELVLPGSEFQVKPISQSTPVVVRILDHSPHGSDRRYNIEYYGLDAGSYDLVDFLERVDGTPLNDVPNISIQISAQLPPGQVEPAELEQKELSGLGGYKTLGIVAGIVWVIGLLAILFVRRGKQHSNEHQVTQPVNLADRLRPLVDRAIRVEVSHAELAELELTLIAFWRKRLHLDAQEASAVIGQLRRHDESGPFLVQLENWLHNPNSEQDIDVAALLKPYQAMPSDAIGLTSTLRLSPQIE